jgi:hypothetical protein
MAATFGVTSIPAGFTKPTGCVIKQISDKTTLDTSKVRSELGVTVRNIPHRMITREVVIDMVGIAPLSLAVPGDFAEGTLKVMRVRNQEGNEDTPQSTVTMKAHFNREEEE